jgi:multicomponent K+:H+ antiporter subunit D
MVAGAAMILLGERWRGATVALGCLSCGGLLVLALLLLGVADAPRIVLYRLGDWPSLFGIVLVLDRLSALMLALVAVLGFAAFVFALPRWQRAGAHFHPLFQFQLMGLNGAFLTGDLFNLFVFFEVVLAASYGMALHGSGVARVRAGLHYLVVNLVAALLFLIGVSVVYGIAGTLNMAELAARMPDLAPEDRGLLETGLAILGVAFVAKAAMWPLCFWLVPVYAAAAAPAAAILSVLSKLGIYALLRLWLLVAGDQAGETAGFGGAWLAAGGLLTLAFGSIAALATQSLPRLAGAGVLISSGTLLAAIGAGDVAVTGGALLYLTGSVLAIGAFFLLIELIERDRDLGADVLAVTREALGTGEDAADEDVVGVAIPGTLALFGVAFLACAAMLAGLPPLAGFLAKFAILMPLLAMSGEPPAVAAWVLLAALVASGAALLIALLRVGIEVFWTSPATQPPRVALLEIAPVGMLLTLCILLTAGAGRALDYMHATAQDLHAPAPYVRAVLPPDADRTR